MHLALCGGSLVLCSALTRATAGLLFKGRKVVFIPYSRLEGDAELVHMALLQVDGLHGLQGLKVSRTVKFKAHVKDGASVVELSVDALVLDGVIQLLSVSVANVDPVRMGDSAVSLQGNDLRYDDWENYWLDIGLANLPGVVVARGRSEEHTSELQSTL